MRSINDGEYDNSAEKKRDSIGQWLSDLVRSDGAKTVPPPGVAKTPVSQYLPMPQPEKKNFSGRRRHGGNRPQRGPHPQRSQGFRPQPAARPSAAPAAKGQLRIIPIGGFEEVGKNMMVFEYERDILIVDMGFQFPTEDMLGIDYVLPDITYLEDKKDRIRGVVLTHGHLDHIGAIPYLLPKLGFPPVYGAAMTIGFVEKQLVEFELNKKAKLITFDPKEHFRLGCFDVSFFRVNHSIPDAVAVVIDSPAGRIVHTGDFKFDFTPADQRPADFQEIAAVGKRGVAVLISDSTNATEPGHTLTEKIVAEKLDEIIHDAKGRLIITSFSSLIGRLQQVIDSALHAKRRIFLTGRSMEANIRIAQQLGYIRVPKGMIMNIREVKRFRDHEIIILTTGSQGEDRSALTRMAMETHAYVKIQKGDTVVLSASPIIGNEAAIVKVINKLARRGAKVITNDGIDIHTSGHAKQEDLKLMIKLIKPRYLIPEHGDFYMRLAHRDLAMEVGMPEKNVLLLDNGQVAKLLTNGILEKTDEKVPAEYIMVEGPERSKVEGHVLMDRQLMAENGVVIVLLKADLRQGKLLQKPRILTRGFVYMDVACHADVVEKVQSEAQKAFDYYWKAQNGVVKPEALAEHLQQHIDTVMTRTVDKRPLIVPLFE